jgi:microcystin-dependent protein
MACVHRGQGQGLSDRFEGEVGGSQTVTLIESEMPAHIHTLNASYDTATEVSPNAQYPAVGSAISFYDTNAQPTTNMAFNALVPAGGSLPHNNMMASLTLIFCIAMQGVFPPRQ